MSARGKKFHVLDINSPPPNPNPYVCNGTDDCYKLWIISPTTNNITNTIVLNGTQVIVEVVNPKQAGAHLKPIQIVSSTNSSPISGMSAYNTTFNILEPMITTDGHLLVGRMQNNTLSWNNNGTQVTGNYNIVYSAGSKTATPCDVNQWSAFYPVAHAYNDSNVNGGRYGFADYQFRDAENIPIPETADIEGNYPWIDRMGRNLFFTQVGATLFNSDNSSSTGVRARYTDNCAVGGCTDPCTVAANCLGGVTQALTSVEESDNTRGLTVVGRWTHGKMVQVDGLVNNIDYGLHLPDSAQRLVSLYQTGTAPRFGSGRFNAPDFNPPDYAENTTILDSFENIFTYLATLKPINLREVTWQLNMGKGGDEIPFDDYVNPEALIISDMTASANWTQYNYPSAANNYNSLTPQKTATYNDGFGATSGFNSAIHIQNAATTVSSQWNIPPFGLVKGSGTPVTARVEPAALGGIKGKGFWLQDGNYISYPISATQPQSVINTPWFISLFVDSRCCTGTGDTTSRRILTFPDSSYINIVGSNKLVLGYLNNGVKTTITGVLPTALNLPTPGGWWHLGLQVAMGGESVGVYVNGFLLTTITPLAPVLQIVPASGCPVGGCQVTLGGDPVTADNVTGFTGWVDEFKVIAQNVDFETICNHAHGTIVGASTAWNTIVSSYPQSSTAGSEGYQINHSRTLSFNDYGCVVNYTSDASATYLPAFSLTTGNLPSGTTSVRDTLHFPEGPLLWDQPRPLSTGNQFCTSCHVDNGGQASVTLGSQITLAAGAPGTPMSTDTRRQPMHPQRLVYGNIPTGYFNGQSCQLTSSPTGAALDKCVFPDPPQ